MIYRTLGRSGLRVSAISFGCMSLGLDENTAGRLIHRGLDLGINYFDTADLYDKGENERLVGKILKERREEVILATKVGNRWRADGGGWDWVPGREYILRAAEDSLSRLQTDRIDLYQLHGGTIEDPFDEILEAFSRLQEQGKICHYGISSIRPEVIRKYASHSEITSEMIQYSLLDRRGEGQVLEDLRHRNIGVLARGSVAKGLLAGKPAAPYLNYATEEVERIARAVKSLSGEKRSPAQTALQWVLGNTAITSAVVGLRTEAQLEDAVGTLEAPWLTEAEIELISYM